MSIDLCNIKFWNTSDGPAKGLPNNYSHDLDFTRYESITIISLDTDCLTKKTADDKLKGVSSITANNLKILSSIFVSSINASNLTLNGQAQAQGENSTNIDINITKDTGKISMVGGGVFVFSNSKITGVGSMNVSNKSYYSRLKSCYIQAYSSNPPSSEKFNLCVSNISEVRPTGGIITLVDSDIGRNIEVNAGMVVLEQSSSSNGNINSFCSFTDSTNQGKITDVSIFYESTNQGTINGPLAIFNGSNSINNGLISARSIFHDGSSNIRLVTGDSVFGHGGFNVGVCSGNSFLYSNGYNQGGIIGNVVISGAKNMGFISGNVTLYGGETSNTSRIIGSVIATQLPKSDGAAKSGILNGDIYGSLVAKNSIINDIYISGTSTFNDCSVGTLIGPTTINATDSILQEVQVLGQRGSCLFTRSSVGGGSLETAAVIFVGRSGNTETNGAAIIGEQASFVFASNLAFISGDASFANCSFNYGRITGNASFDNTSYNFGTVDGECSGPGCLPEDTHDDSLCV